jgi:micrococcal nuclease
MDGKLCVRLLGVDTARHGHGEPSFEREAADLVRRCAEGREVRLELDRERRDPNGRILAWVYADGSLVNEELIRAGFSRAEIRFNIELPIVHRLRRAEEEARREGRGVWQRSTASSR